MQGGIQHEQLFAIFSGSGKLLESPRKLIGKDLCWFAEQANHGDQTFVGIAINADDPKVQRDSNSYWVASRARLIVTRNDIFAVSEFRDSRAPRLRRLLDDVSVAVISRGEARVMLAPAHKDR